MSRYRLSRRAEQSFTDILRWTFSRFGRTQAETYRTKLLGSLEKLAAGVPPHGRSCRTLVAELRRIPDLEYYREGRHYIIYRMVEDELYVVDIIHGSRDLEAMIRSLSATTETDNE